MIDVDFDTSAVRALSSILGDDFVAAVLDDLATGARAKWIRLASSKLNSSRSDYLEGISEVEYGNDSRTISLTGWLPNAIEEGIDSFDMRKTLLGDSPTSKPAKVSKSGHKYKSIPFRHATPGTKGAVGAAMGSRMGPQGASSLAWGSGGIMSKGQAAKLGNRLYKAAKSLQAGQRLKTSDKRRKGFVQVPKLAPHHSSSIYAGMTRQITSGPARKGAQRQSLYTTFRTISEATDTGWIHPGITARRLIPDVEAFARTLIDGAIRVGISRALGKL